MSKHTPGPWEVEEMANGFRIQNPYLVVTDIRWASGADRSNARLIAAAPDLLAAAKAMFEKGAHGFDMLRAAIAKAEGEL
jgi:hypothetical protein